MRKVRTTMQPWREIEVSDAEYADLSRQGVLVEDEPSKSGRTAAVTPEEK